MSTTLTPDELLSGTRQVRRHMDYERPVPRELLEECLDIARQAPTASNMQPWSFVVVTDPERKAAIGEQYRKSWAIYETMPIAAGNLHYAGDDERNAVQQGVMRSATYLAERYHEVPAMVIPCLAGRFDGENGVFQCTMYSSVIQASWSFQLAARTRGLATCWTTLHLIHEREVAEILGIPYDEVQQIGLITVGYATKDKFKPNLRGPLDEIVHWEAW